MKKKSILVNEIAHKELTRLAAQFNSNFGQLVADMILFFKKTGINPKAPIKENPSLLVKQLDKRIVSFLKVQERDILKPIRSDIYQYQTANEKIKTENKEHLKGKFLELDEKLDRITSEIRKQRNVHMEIAVFLDSKNKSGLLTRVQSIFQS